MSSVRELLEQAAPAAPRGAPPASEVRRRGDRRRRRGVAGGVLVAAVAVVGAVVLGAALLQPGARPGPDGQPTAGQSLNWRPVRALEGTRWVPDLVAMGVVDEQAYPDEKGEHPRALLTFEPAGVLVLDLMLPGRPTTSVHGSWKATSTWPELGAALRADVRLVLVAPPGASPEVTGLIARLNVATTAEGMVVGGGVPPSLVGVVLFLYGTTHSFVYGVLDQVRTDVVLPAPYPARP